MTKNKAQKNPNFNDNTQAVDPTLQKKPLDKSNPKGDFDKLVNDPVNKNPDKQ